MRPGATFAEEQPAAPAPARGAHSPWHSPVPYLFGGLAAMLGLIAFALLILACSYWKLSGYLEGEGTSGASEDAEKAGDSGGKVPLAVYEERIVVIMAGDKKPTFLATPASSRASSFGDRNAGGDGGDGGGDCSGDGNKMEGGENGRNQVDNQTQREEL